MKPTELVIETRELRHAALAWGPASGRRILAVHGWMDNAASFSRLAPCLDGARVVALDLPGHGHSDHLPSAAVYTFLDWVVRLHDVVESLAWSDCTIIGHSLGAGLAVAFAATWPERVERLVLLDGFAPKTQELSETTQRLVDYTCSRRRLSTSRPRVHAGVDAAAEHLRGSVAGLDAAASRILAARGTVPCAGGVRWRRDRRMAAGPPMRLLPAHIREFLRRLQTPTLMIRPRDGWPYPADILAELRSLEAVEYVEVPGGHHVHLVAPDVVVAPVRAFLGLASPAEQQGNDQRAR